MVGLAGGDVGVDGDVVEQLVQDPSAHQVEDAGDLCQIRHLHLRPLVQLVDEQPAVDTTESSL